MIHPLNNNKANPKKYRVIKTARNLETINNAAKKGYKPLVKKVEPSQEIKSKFTIFQNKKTNEIEFIVDSRTAWRYKDDDNFIQVIDRTFYYPYNFESPFAAYLIPNDIEIGEFVFLEDLIEDLIGFKWNQGVTKRLESCEAKWNGKDFDILYDARNVTSVMG